MKKIGSILFVLLIWIGTIGAVYEIDAARNASIHNNRGVNLLKEKYYFGAIKEFEIAIQINPDTQATATYYNNLGKTYLLIGYPNLAEESFKFALSKNSANFEFYQNLVTSYKQQNKLQKELKKAMADKKNVSKVIAGLILIETDKIESGINMLDEFCFDNPDMILTKGVRNYINQNASEKIRF